MDKENLATVLVIDFGAQYAQLIARRVRECKVYSEIVPHNISAKEIRERAPKGIILSGGPASVYAENTPQLDDAIIGLGIPILGICYGMQILTHQLGGVVEKTGRSEFGKTNLEVEETGLLFHELPRQLEVWMSHRDSVIKEPPGFISSAKAPDAPVAAMENIEKKIFGVQFHPEVGHTPKGLDILKNFLYNACECMPTWTSISMIDDASEAIIREVKDKKIICGLSGGVDSAVAAVLVHKAVGDNLTCVFVDHGMLRKDEAKQVEETFRKHFHINLIHVNAKERFLAKLAGVTDPEQKRIIIGEEFIRVFEAEAKKLKDVDFLVQGTLYPDVIESGTKDAAKIKTHHNVGGIPMDMQFKLIEPLRLLFKDEVRVVGEELGLHDDIVWRQPFPGPGLAIRIIGEVTEERLEILREADAIVTEEIKRAGLYKKIWQSFAVLPAIKSVGVQGDQRSYAHPIAIRAVTSEDAMTADWMRMPYEILEKMSSRIINEVPHVNRVVYDISSKPPSTIEWE